MPQYVSPDFSLGVLCGQKQKGTRSPNDPQFRFLCPKGLFYYGGRICEKCLEQKSFFPALKQRDYRNSKVQTLVAATILQVHRWLGSYRKSNYLFLTEFNKSKFADLIDVNGENIFVNQVPYAKEMREIKTKFVFAGRLERNKGIDFILDVWPELPEAYELHIYGDGTSVCG